MLSPSGYSILTENEDFELSAAPSNDLAGDIKSAADDPKSGEESQNDSKNSLHSPDISVIKNESMFQIALEMLFPFILAGIGMVLAGLLFDHVQHWDVFDSIHELFILIPPLLGLKGNLEMTLASRLSTAVS